MAEVIRNDLVFSAIVHGIDVFFMEMMFYCFISTHKSSIIEIVIQCLAFLFGFQKHQNFDVKKEQNCIAN